jgi:hypothetical protein
MNNDYVYYSEDDNDSLDNDSEDANDWLDNYSGSDADFISEGLPGTWVLRGSRVRIKHGVEVVMEFERHFTNAIAMINYAEEVYYAVVAMKQMEPHAWVLRDGQEIFSDEAQWLTDGQYNHVFGIHPDWRTGQANN